VQGNGVAPNPVTLTPTSNVTVTDNQSSGNHGGGVVVAAYHSGAGVTSVTVTGNAVTGTVGQFGPHGPVMGGIVVAVDSPATSVSSVTVQNNTVTGNTIGHEFYEAWLAGDRGTALSGDMITTTPGGQAVFNVPVAGTGAWMGASDGGVFGFGEAGFRGSMGGEAISTRRSWVPDR
jgi:hypothetical protein